MHECGFATDSISQQGTLYFDTNVYVEVFHSNFTACELPFDNSDGCAGMVTGVQAQRELSHFRFCTFFRSSGRTVIWSSRWLGITSCNFVGNAILSVIWCNDESVTLVHCYLKNNILHPKGDSLQILSGRNGVIALDNNTFDVSWGSVSCWIVSTGTYLNFFGVSELETTELSHLNTYVCDVNVIASDQFTSSSHFSFSDCFSDSSNVVRSHSLSASDGLFASSCVSLSPNLLSSSLFNHTDCLNHSAFLLSSNLDFSLDFFASSRFYLSSHFGFSDFRDGSRDLSPSDCLSGPTNSFRLSEFCSGSVFLTVFSIIHKTAHFAVSSTVVSLHFEAAPTARFVGSRFLFGSEATFDSTGKFPDPTVESSTLELTSHSILSSLFITLIIMSAAIVLVAIAVGTFCYIRHLKTSENCSSELPVTGMIDFVDHSEEGTLVTYVNAITIDDGAGIFANDSHLFLE
jgi:hypothetical protein